MSRRRRSGSTPARCYVPSLLLSYGWLGFTTMDNIGVVERNIGAIVREIVDRRRNPYGQRGGPP